MYVANSQVEHIEYKNETKQGLIGMTPTTYLNLERDVIKVPFGKEHDLHQNKDFFYVTLYFNVLY